jgi:acyl carrier protein
MNDKLEEIKKAFAERLGVKEVDESKTMRELGLDSLAVVELCLDLEDRYNIHFETEELSSINTVKDLYDAISKKLN